MLSNFYILAFTHQNLDLSDVGQLVLSDEARISRIPDLKELLGLDEVFYIGTCNRVEIVMLSQKNFQPGSIQTVLHSINAELDPVTIARLCEGSVQYEGLRALDHLIRVSCSLESMVVGEKEIHAQVRAGYEEGKAAGTTGDLMRLIMNCVVKAAKEVYTSTRISQKPISVVSLAYRKLKSLKTPLHARILIIGAGKTNSLFSKYLIKHGYHNFSIFNRTLKNAEVLAAELKGAFFDLPSLEDHTMGFDVLITCTGAAEPIVSKDLYEKLLAGERDKKILIDLSIPNDLDPLIPSSFPVLHITVEALQDIARKNMDDRYNELSEAEQIIHRNVEEFKPVLHQRKVELAMKDVPRKIREIRTKAVENVFAKDLESMDEGSRKTLEKVLNYMEKKYISVPMLMAKEILVKV